MRKRNKIILLCICIILIGIFTYIGFKNGFFISGPDPFGIM